MGFGFYLGFIFIILPLTGILLIVWALTRKKIFGKILGFIWLSLIGLIFFSVILQWLTAKKELEKEDYYGQYVIDRNYFKGKQANWQYNNFRFEIRKNDSIYFYLTENEKILKIYKGTISTVKPWNSERLVINMIQPTNHIIKTNPTVYRSAWGFYLVFHSDKFNNIYFKKGKWIPIIE